MTSFNPFAEELLSPSAKLRILQILYTWSSGILSERQLAKLCGLSHSNVRYGLEALQRIRLVSHKRVGSSNVWELNRNYYCFAALSRILEELQTLTPPLQFLLDQLMPLLKSPPLQPHVVSAFLFGSVLKKDFYDAGDIDLAVITKRSIPELQDLLFELSGKLLGLLGKRLEPHFFDLKEWRRLQNKPLGQDIVKGRKII